MQIAPMEGPYGQWEGKDMGSIRIRSYTYVFVFCAYSLVN